MNVMQHLNCVFIELNKGSNNHFVVTREGNVLASNMKRCEAELELSLHKINGEDVYLSVAPLGNVKVGQTRPHCILIGDEDEIVSDSWLTLREAEDKLCNYLNQDVDAYISVTYTWLIEIGREHQAF